MKQLISKFSLTYLCFLLKDQVVSHGYTMHTFVAFVQSNVNNIHKVHNVQLFYNFHNHNIVISFVIFIIVILPIMFIMFILFRMEIKVMIFIYFIKFIIFLIFIIIIVFQLLTSVSPLVYSSCKHVCSCLSCQILSQSMTFQGGTKTKGLKLEAFLFQYEKQSKDTFLAPFLPNTRMILLKHPFCQFLSD